MVCVMVVGPCIRYYGVLGIKEVWEPLNSALLCPLFMGF